MPWKWTGRPQCLPLGNKSRSNYEYHQGQRWKWRGDHPSSEVHIRSCQVRTEIAITKELKHWNWLSILLPNIKLSRAVWVQYHTALREGHTVDQSGARRPPEAVEHVQVPIMVMIKRFDYEDHLPIQWFILLFSSIIKAPISQITQYSLLLTNTVDFGSPSSTSDSIDLLELIIVQTSADLSTLLLDATPVSYNITKRSLKTYCLASKKYFIIAFASSSLQSCSSCLNGLLWMWIPWRVSVFQTTWETGMICFHRSPV